jgi:hypothetical protein
MKSLFMFLVLVTLILPFSLTSAQSPAPGSIEDNACNRGGVMADKCTTQWHWVCGYYLARWQSNGGWFTRNNPFNDACLSLLPPVPVSVQESAIFFPGFCLAYVGGAYNDEIIPSSNSPFVTGIQLTSNDGSCSGAPNGTTYLYFYGTMAEALTNGVCIGPEPISNYNPIFAPSNLIYCV